MRSNVSRSCTCHTRLLGISKFDLEPHLEITSHENTVWDSVLCIPENIVSDGVLEQDTFPRSDTHATVIDVSSEKSPRLVPRHPPC
jgi:hypothetical protein